MENFEDHTQPEPSFDYNGNEINGSTDFLDHGQILMNGPRKRKIRPRVLKSEYDRLKRKYSILTWIAWAGWIGFIVVLKMAI